MSREVMADCLEEAAVQWGTLMERGWPPSDECRTFTEADKGCIATIAVALYRERCRHLLLPTYTPTVETMEWIASIHSAVREKHTALLKEAAYGRGTDAKSP